MGQGTSGGRSMFRPRGIRTQKSRAPGCFDSDILLQSRASENRGILLRYYPHTVYGHKKARRCIENTGENNTHSNILYMYNRTRRNANSGRRRGLTPSLIL